MHHLDPRLQCWSSGETRAWCSATPCLTGLGHAPKAGRSALPVPANVSPKTRMHSKPQPCLIWIASVQDQDAVRFQLPADASPWTRAAASFCQGRLRLPELVLVVLFGVRPWAWAALAAWLVGAPLAHRLEVRLGLA